MTTPSVVPDIRTIQAFSPPYYDVTIDWSLRSDGTLDDTGALASAVVVALGTNGLADVNAELPDPDSTDRAGWWGDLDADTIWNGWDIGSQLWLLRRSAINTVASRTGSTVAHVISYIQLAIQPFVDNQICSRFDVWAERSDRQRIDATVTIYRGPSAPIILRYQILWDELTGASPPPGRS